MSKPTPFWIAYWQEFVAGGVAGPFIRSFVYGLLTVGILGVVAFYGLLAGIVSAMLIVWLVSRR